MNKRKRPARQSEIMIFFPFNTSFLNITKETARESHRTPPQRRERERRKIGGGGGKKIQDGPTFQELQCSGNKLVWCVMNNTDSQLKKTQYHARNGVMNNVLHWKEILHLSVMYANCVLLGDALCILQSKVPKGVRLPCFHFL